MAKNTDPRLRKQVIYSIYIRAHTPEGTFLSVIRDLPRIRALGTDIIWFMPIHSIGVVGKKGSLGCPYANRDYRDVNPAYGTMEDLPRQRGHHGHDRRQHLRPEREYQRNPDRDDLVNINLRSRLNQQTVNMYIVGVDPLIDPNQMCCTSYKVSG